METGPSSLASTFLSTNPTNITVNCKHLSSLILITLPAKAVGMIEQTDRLKPLWNPVTRDSRFWNFLFSMFQISGKNVRFYTYTLRFI